MIWRLSVTTALTKEVPAGGILWRSTKEQKAFELSCKGVNIYVTTSQYVYTTCKLCRLQEELNDLIYPYSRSLRQVMRMRMRQRILNYRVSLEEKALRAHKLVCIYLGLNNND